MVMRWGEIECVDCGTKCEVDLNHKHSLRCDHCRHNRTFTLEAARQKKYKKALTPTTKARRESWRKLRNPATWLLAAAKARAKAKGLPFNLELNDIVIPENCPVLGIPLVRGEGRMHRGSPTLDRLIPELGYVRGNVAVISQFANTIKQNATPQQIRAVANWCDQQIREHN